MYSFKNNVKSYALVPRELKKEETTRISHEIFSDREMSIKVDMTTNTQKLIEEYVEVYIDLKEYKNPSTILSLKVLNGNLKIVRVNTQEPENGFNINLISEPAFEIRLDLRNIDHIKLTFSRYSNGERSGEVKVSLK